jgi:hypothetical protein
MRPFIHHFRLILRRHGLHRLTACALVLAFATMEPMAICKAQTAQTNQTEEATQTEPLRYADDWILYQPPNPATRHDAFGPYLSITVNTQPLATQLPTDAHPMLVQLNQFETLTLKPDPTLIWFNHNVMVNQQTHTPHLLNALVPSQQVKAPGVNHNSDYFFTPASIFKDFARSGKGKSFLTNLAKVPGQLLLVAMCTPFWLITAPASISNNINNKKQRKLAEKTMQQNAATGAKALQVFKQAIDEKQQTFNPQFNNPQAPFGVGRPFVYPILPAPKHYRLDLLDKTVTYVGLQPEVSIHWAFKAPYPTVAQFKLITDKALQNPQPSPNGYQPITLAFTPGNPDPSPSALLTGCTLTYTHRFRQAALVCQPQNQP